MKYKNYLIALAVVLLALVGYHYFAASRAAGQIDEALQEQSRDPDNSFTIVYADIDIHPFSGDITLQDVQFNQPGHLSSASSLHFDMTYLDFLRFYIGGTEYGLRKLHNSTITAHHTSVEIPSSGLRFTSDTMSIAYSGQIYDLLRHRVSSRPLEKAHHLQATLRSPHLTQPTPDWGNFAADTLTFNVRIPAESTSWVEASHISVKTRPVTWIPPQSFRTNYEFFIRGFGYEPDSIGMDSLSLRLVTAGKTNLKNMTGELYTDLFHLRATADILIDRRRPGRSIIQNGILNLPRLSEQFANFLQNFEQLFGISLPQQRKQILRFEGPIMDPVITRGRGNEDS